MSVGFIVEDKDFKKLNLEEIKKEGFETTTLTGGKYGKITFKGPYSKLGEGWHKFIDNGKGKGHEFEEMEVNGNNYERYIDDPESVEVPRTELYFRLLTKRKREEKEEESENKEKKSTKSLSKW